MKRLSDHPYLAAAFYAVVLLVMAIVIAGATRAGARHYLEGHYARVERMEPVWWGGCWGGKGRRTYEFDAVRDTGEKVHGRLCYGSLAKPVIHES